MPILNERLDFINLMTYDLHGAGWEPTVADHHAPLYRRSSDTVNLNVNSSVNYWISKGASAAKIVMGIPLYGQVRRIHQFMNFSLISFFLFVLIRLINSLNIIVIIMEVELDYHCNHKQCPTCISQWPGHRWTLHARKGNLQLLRNLFEHKRQRVASGSRPPRSNGSVRLHSTQFALGGIRRPRLCHCQSQLHHFKGTRRGNGLGH